MVLRLSGRLTAEQIIMFDNALKKFLSEGHRYFVLNMIDVKDLSSTGIAKILNTVRNVDGKDGCVVLSELSPVVEYVLKLSDMKSAFECYPTDEQALAALRSVSGDY